MNDCCPVCGYCATQSHDAAERKLPRRYRTAYRYLLANLREPDLAVEDVAASIGVSTRALQAAWKKYLDCSPAESIRNLRAQRIRVEIVTTTASVMQCGEKWGIYQRNTLCHLFREVFGRSPASFRGPLEAT